MAPLAAPSGYASGHSCVRQFIPVFGGLGEEGRESVFDSAPYLAELLCVSCFVSGRSWKEPGAWPTVASCHVVTCLALLPSCDAAENATCVG